MISRLPFALLTLVLATASRPAVAVNPIALDRDYRFGDDSVESAVTDGPVGAGFSGFTADTENSASIGGSNDSFQDLQAFGNPVYRAISGRPDSVGGRGIEFDGDGDYLKGANLHDPATSQGSLGYNDDEGEAPVNNPGPLNYAGLSNRFFQFWVMPDGASSADTQSLVMDTNQHGVRIVSGKWSMRYAGADFQSDVDVAFDQWSHVMLSRPSGPAGGAQMYVNGVAVSAAPGGYDDSVIENLVIGSNTSRDATNSFDGGTEEFFHGLMDDLSMWVVGDNSSDIGPPVGQDFGQFEFFTDNSFASDVYAFDLLDLDQNGTPADAGDVAAFVTGWRTPNEVNGVRVGDLTTLANGDVNFDGITDLRDWSIINAANPSAGLAIMSALAGTVPEPGSLLLLGMGCALTSVRRLCRR